MHTTDIPLDWKGMVSVVKLDPGWLNPSNVTAAMVFPADHETAVLFRTGRETKDNTGQLRYYRNFSMVRWVRPENIEILQEFWHGDDTATERQRVRVAPKESPKLTGR
jgi:hypothetical protein